MAVDTHRAKPETTSTDRTEDEALRTVPSFPKQNERFVNGVSDDSGQEILKEVSFPGSNTKFLIPYRPPRLRKRHNSESGLPGCLPHHHLMKRAGSFSHGHENTPLLGEEGRLRSLSEVAETPEQEKDFEDLPELEERMKSM